MKKVPSTPTPSKAFQVVNILNVKGPLKAGTYLHFTAEQWKQATAKLESGKAVPKFGLRVAYFPFPDGGVIVQADCVQGKCEIDCMVRTRFTPDREFIFDCRCKRDPACLNEPDPRTPKCALKIVPGRGLQCVSQGCTGRCKITNIPIPGGRGLIVCVCS